ncbi:MAG: MarR family transcriptional regulator [Lachnospiraceae bacterium]|nr:MarR family transcriptional regulator [Lachnospiraceae bacterium]
MDVKEIQKDLLLLLPHWNYRIIRPIKQLLDDGVSLEMYYCLQMLRTSGAVTMTKFSEMINMPKHQLSKMSNRLFEQNFIERIYDPADRRITKIKITDTAVSYMDKFRSDNTDCYHEFMDYLEPSELNRFGEAVRTILELFCKVSEMERDN